MSPGDLKAAPGSETVFLVGFLSKWREQNKVVVLTTFSWGKLVLEGLNPQDSRIGDLNMLEIAKVCGCWALRRCCFQSITF